MRRHLFLSLLLLLGIGFSFGQKVQILNGGFEEVLPPPVSYECSDGNITFDTYQPKHWPIAWGFCCKCYEDLLSSPKALDVGVSLESHSGTYSNAITWYPQNYWEGRIDRSSVIVQREQEIANLSSLTYRVKGYYRLRVWINDVLTNLTDLDDEYKVFNAFYLGGLHFHFENTSNDWTYFEAIQRPDGTCELVSGEGFKFYCTPPLKVAGMYSILNLSHAKSKNITEIEFLLDDIELEVIVPSVLKTLYEEYTDFDVLPIKEAVLNTTQWGWYPYHNITPLPHSLSDLHIYAGKNVTGLKTYMLNVSWDAKVYGVACSGDNTCGIYLDNVTLYYENGTLYGVENATTYDFFEMSTRPGYALWCATGETSPYVRVHVSMPVPKEVNRLKMWLRYVDYYGGVRTLARGYMDITLATEELRSSDFSFNDSALNRSLPIYYPNPIVSFVKRGRNVTAYHVGLVPEDIWYSAVYTDGECYPVVSTSPTDNREIWFRNNLLESYTDTNTTLGNVTEHVTDFSPYYYTSGDEVYYLGDQVDYYSHVYRPESIYVFGESYPLVFCPSYCYGPNYYEREIVEGECTYTVYTCDERCIPDMNVTVLEKGSTWVKFGFTDGFDSSEWWITEAGGVYEIVSGSTNETTLTVVGLTTNKTYDMHVEGKSYLGCPTYRYGEVRFTLGTVAPTYVPPEYTRQMGEMFGQAFQGGALVMAGIFNVGTDVGSAIFWLLITLGAVYLFAMYIPSVLEININTGMVAVIVLMLMSVVGAISGVLPVWVTIVIIVLTAGVFAYFMKKVFE